MSDSKLRFINILLIIFYRSSLAFFSIAQNFRENLFAPKRRTFFFRFPILHFLTNHFPFEWAFRTMRWIHSCARRKRGSSPPQFECLANINRNSLFNRMYHARNGMIAFRIFVHYVLPLYVRRSANLHVVYWLGSSAERQVGTRSKCARLALPRTPPHKTAVDASRVCECCFASTRVARCACLEGLRKRSGDPMYNCRAERNGTTTETIFRRMGKNGEKERCDGVCAREKRAHTIVLMWRLYAIGFYRAQSLSITNPILR